MLLIDHPQPTTLQPILQNRRKTMEESCDKTTSQKSRYSEKPESGSCSGESITSAGELALTSRADQLFASSGTKLPATPQCPVLCIHSQSPTCLQCMNQSVEGATYRTDMSEDELHLAPRKLPKFLGARFASWHGLLEQVWSTLGYHQIPSNQLVCSCHQDSIVANSHL